MFARLCDLLARAGVGLRLGEKYRRAEVHEQGVHGVVDGDDASNK
jgi:hypothetical protein